MKKHYVIAFVAGMMSDFWWGGCAYTVNHNMPMWSFFFNSTFPLVNWVGLMQAVDHKEGNERIKLAVFTGLGYGIGSIIFFFSSKYL